MNHMALFIQHGLCKAAPSVYGEDVFGQWRECMKKRDSIDCITCRLAITIVEANGLEKLFDKDIRALAAEINRLLSQHTE